MESLEFSARCAFGFEDVLSRELKDLGINRVRPLKGGVAFFGTVKQAYRVCLWSRVASRVLMVLSRFDCPDADALYAGASAIDWPSHILPDSTIAIYARGTTDELRNTQFTSLKVKDAVCDSLRAAYGSRPDVDPKHPDVRLQVGLNGKRATISFDLTGESLHRRGYRADGIQAVAPMKEALAAGMLLKAGWAEIAAAEGTFIDPMCGSGTLCIEAAMIAFDMAPGILRDRWGFFGWAQHDDEIWTDLLDEADGRYEIGRSRRIRLIASDIDPHCIELARDNAKRAGFADAVEFSVCDAADIATLLRSEHRARGLMAVNPPYGERLSTTSQLPAVYSCLAKGISSLPQGWVLAVITPEGDLIDAACGLPTRDVVEVYNGSLPATLRIYDIVEMHRRMLALDEGGTGKTVKVVVLEKNTEQFASRLKKVARERRKWARREGVSAYRIYDSDLPDYAVAIDLYHGAGPSEGDTYVVVAEYKAPAEIDATRAARRLRDVMATVPVILGIPANHVFCKQRRRDVGGSQYSKNDRHDTFTAFTAENGYVFELDLAAYLDTGIFLDHRITRAMVGSMAQGKRFLNLFAYTGTATVHAAGAGASETTTVDLSQTYLDWARRNMENNGFSGRNHHFIRADVTSWITQERRSKRRYDVIFVDPPTFSNSKAMGKNTWAVDRDHVELLIGVSRLLTADGVAVFSCNQRGFKIDAESLAKYGVEVEDITPETIPVDFKRNAKIHHCYRITRAAH